MFFCMCVGVHQWGKRSVTENESSRIRRNLLLVAAMSKKTLVIFCVSRGFSLRIVRTFSNFDFEIIDKRCPHVGNTVKIKAVKRLNKPSALRNCSVGSTSLAMHGFARDRDRCTVQDCQKEAAVAESDDEAKAAVTVSLQAL